MSFIQNNWYLLLLVIVSAALLFVPSMRKGGKSGLTPADAVQKINREKAVIVDVRSADEFAPSHIKGAKNIAAADLEAQLPGAVKSKSLPIILVCASGLRAQKAAATVQKLGYTNVHVLAGGLGAWKSASLPLTAGGKA